MAKELTRWRIGKMIKNECIVRHREMLSVATVARKRKTKTPTIQTSTCETVN